MRITMIKKRKTSGEPCRKCNQTEEMLKNRGLWERIDEVVWALEGEPDSEGMRLAREHDVEAAPFFIVTRDNGEPAVYRSALALIREVLAPGKTGKVPGTDRKTGKAGKVAKTGKAGGTGKATTARGAAGEGFESVVQAFAGAEPGEMISWALERFGDRCAIAFSGAEDVVLIDMAARTGLGFSVFVLDTGRLHPETYEFVDRVRVRYGISIEVMSPDAAELQGFVRKKGLFSFYEDGHKECCGVRKVAPLERALAGYGAWMTGQRRDQSPDTRADVPEVQVDPRFRGVGGGELVKLNPLARWSSQMTWAYIRENDVPYNPLHERGYISIGCAPCTRPVLPGQHEREGRWWWELAGSKECGLHTSR